MNDNGKFLLALWVAIALALAIPVFQGAAAQSAAESADFVRRQDRESGESLGRLLPGDLGVSNQGGKIGNLAGYLRGPVLIIKTVEGCPPCDALIDFVKSNIGKSPIADDAQIAVLLMGSESVHSKAQADTDKLIWLNTPEFLVDDGVLGGATLPAVYFFDRDLRLDGIHAGLAGGSDAAMAAALDFSRGLSDAPEDN